MELAAVAFGGLGSALSGVAAMGSTTLSVLSGVATLGSVLMGNQAAKAEEQAGRVAQQEAVMQADAARLDGERQVNESAARAVEIQREHVRKIAAARVAFAGSGLDISSGQLGAIERSLGREAEYGIGLESGNQRIARAGADLRAGQYELQGANALAAGRSRASARRLGGVVDAGRGLLSFAKRG